MQLDSTYFFQYIVFPAVLMYLAAAPPPFTHSHNFFQMHFFSLQYCSLALSHIVQWVVLISNILYIWYILLLSLYLYDERPFMNLVSMCLYIVTRIFLLSHIHII